MAALGIMFFFAFSVLFNLAYSYTSAVNEHQPSCFAGEEERGEQWKGSGATKTTINEVKSSL